MKYDLLKQIDDAASVYGQTNSSTLRPTPSTNITRSGIPEIDSRRGRKLNSDLVMHKLKEQQKYLNNNNEIPAYNTGLIKTQIVPDDDYQDHQDRNRYKSPKLKAQNLMIFKSPQDKPNGYDHNQSLKNSVRSHIFGQQNNLSPRQPNEDLRSLRSEYNYGKKKKFNDILGQKSMKSPQKSYLNTIAYGGQQYMPNGDENYRRDKHSMLGRGSPKTMMNSTQKSYGPGLDAQNVLRKVSLNAAKKAAQGNRFGGSVQRERTGEAFMSDLKKGSYENPTAHNYTHEPIHENEEELAEDLPDSALQILDLDGDERKDIVDQYFQIINRSHAPSKDGFEAPLIRHHQPQNRSPPKENLKYVNIKKGKSSYDVKSPKMKHFQPKQYQHGTSGYLNNVSVDQASSAMFGGKTYNQLTDDQQIRLYESLKITGNQNLIMSHRKDIQKNETKKVLIKNLQMHETSGDLSTNHQSSQGMYLTRNNKVINHWPQTGEQTKIRNDLRKQYTTYNPNQTKKQIAFDSSALSPLRKDIRMETAEYKGPLITTNNQEYQKDLLQMIKNLSKRRGQERNNLEIKNSLNNTMPENGPIKLQQLNLKQKQQPQQQAMFLRAGSNSPRHKSTVKPRFCRTHENSVNFDQQQSRNDYTLGDELDYESSPFNEISQTGKLSSTAGYRQPSKLQQYQSKDGLGDFRDVTYKLGSVQQNIPQAESHLQNSRSNTFGMKGNSVQIGNSSSYQKSSNNQIPHHFGKIYNTNKDFKHMVQKKFPTTTNEDFSNMVKFEMSHNILNSNCPENPHSKPEQERFHYKKMSEFSSFVEASFNKGVFQKPAYDLI